jgi:mitofilin
MMHQVLRVGTRRFSSQSNGSRSFPLFKWTAGLTLTLGSLYLGTTYAAVHNKSFETLYREHVPSPQTHLDLVSHLEKKLTQIQWETAVQDSVTAIGASVATAQQSVTDQLNQLSTWAESQSKDLSQALTTVSQSVESVMREFEQWKASIESWSHETLALLDDQSKKIKQFLEEVQLWMNQFTKGTSLERSRLEPMAEDKVNQSAQNVIQDFKVKQVPEKVLVEVKETEQPKEEEKQSIPIPKVEEKNVIMEEKKIAPVNEAFAHQEKSLVEEAIYAEEIKEPEKEDANQETISVEESKALDINDTSTPFEEKSLEKERRVEKDTPLPIKKSRQEVANELVLLLTGIAGKTQDSSLSNPLKELANSIPSIINAEYTTEADFQVIHGQILNIVHGVESLLSNQKSDFDAELKKQSQEFTVLLGDYVVQYEMELEALKKSLEKQHEEHLLAQKEELEGSHMADLNFELQKQAKEFDMMMKEQLFEQEQALREFWKKESKKMIDQERSGRLARLDHLAYQVKLLEMVLKEYCEHVERNVNVQRLSLACQSLKEKMAQKSKMIDVTAELKLLKKAGYGIELVNCVLDSLKHQKVSSFGRLQRQFDELTESLRRTQLMPDNGGPLSYYLSLLFSYLLFIPIGYVRGDDTGSILARTRHYLQEKDLDNAARELNQIKGRWMRLIVKTWLDDARAHLELKQAIEVNH